MKRRDCIKGIQMTGDVMLTHTSLEAADAQTWLSHVKFWPAGGDKVGKHKLELHVGTMNNIIYWNILIEYIVCNHIQEMCRTFWAVGWYRWWEVSPTNIWSCRLIHQRKILVCWANRGKSWGGNLPWGCRGCSPNGMIGGVGCEYAGEETWYRGRKRKL